MCSRCALRPTMDRSIRRARSLKLAALHLLEKLVALDLVLVSAALRRGLVVRLAWLGFRLGILGELFHQIRDLLVIVQRHSPSDFCSRFGSGHLLNVRTQ